MGKESVSDPCASNAIEHMFGPVIGEVGIINGLLANRTHGDSTCRPRVTRHVLSKRICRYSDICIPRMGGFDDQSEKHHERFRLSADKDGQRVVTAQ